MGFRGGVYYHEDLSGILRGYILCDLEGAGIYEAARYGFEWDFERGHITMRFGFELV